MGTQQKKKEKTTDIRATVAEIKRTQDIDVAKLALEPTFELGYSPIGIGTSSNVIVTTTIVAGVQTGFTDVIPPAQVTGLSATPISGSQIDLSWNANSDFDLNHYNVYRGTTPGFAVTLGVTTPVGTPSGNAFSDTGRTALTTYYYKVSAVDNSGNIGPLSSEVSATTFSAGFVSPMLELHFEGTGADTSPNTYPGFWLGAAGTNGYTTGQFGQGVNLNTPVTPSSSTKDGFQYVDSDCPLLRMNTSVGFSFSCWIFPVDLTHAVGFRRYIIEKADDASNYWSLSIDSAGILYFLVTKAGITYKRQISGFILNSWQHVGAVFNGSTNTVEVYRNGVAGVSSTAAEASTYTPANLFIAASWANRTSTYYEGILDELRYYQVVLNSTQINNLKNTNST